MCSLAVHGLSLDALGQVPVSIQNLIAWSACCARSKAERLSVGVKKVRQCMSEPLSCRVSVQYMLHGCALRLVKECQEGVSVHVRTI